MAREDNEGFGGYMESKFSLIEYNRLISRLSLEQIRNLSDEEILDLAIERPDHPGQYGFLLNPMYFRSQEHLAATLHALLEQGLEGRREFYLSRMLRKIVLRLSAYL